MTINAEIDLSLIKRIQTKIPKMIFNGDNLRNNPQRGLQDLGPFDAEKISRKFNQIHFEIIYESGLIESEIQGVLDHIKADNNRYGNYVKVFKLDNIDFADKIYWHKIQSETDLIQGIADIKSRYEPFENQIATCCLFFTKEYKGDSNTPFYDMVHKHCLHNGYICQAISMKKPEKGEKADFTTFQTMDNNTKLYFARNLQLQIYSKLGGIPWAIEPQASQTDMYLGLGFARLQSESSEVKFAVGALSFFDRNGLWKKLKVSSQFDYSSHRRQSGGLYAPYEIITSLIKELSVLKKSNNDMNTLVVHKQNRFANEEVRGFIDYSDENDLKTALVEVVQTDFDLFSSSSQKYKPPQSGFSLIIGSNKSLLINTDPSDNREIGTPMVLEVIIRPESTLELKISDAIQQIRDLTYISWRDLYKQSYLLPATLSYSYKAALAYASGINPHSSLLDKPWFL